MDVVIEAIKFNHDPNAATVDAFTIRKNANDDITVPEWQSQGVQNPPITSAVAYARTQGNALTIAVQVRRLSPNVQRVHVSAESTSVLGNVVRDTIEFSGNDLSDFKPLNLAGARISSAAVGKSKVVLLWRLEVDSGQPPNRVFEQQTEHTVYTLLESPKEPWGPGFEAPWTEALDLACDWAAGATDCTQAAAMITRRLHGLGLSGLLSFPQNVTFSRVSFNGTQEINFTRLLRHVQGTAGPLFVSCTDCAILVSTFANILGCDLYQSKMGLRFDTNPIRVIGFQGEGSRHFDYHEVAWEFPCDSQARLFDCCLQVDGDPDPSGGFFDPLLPINIPLGDASGTDYHFRLAAQNTSGANMHAFPGSKKRRHIARLTFRVLPIIPEFEEILKDRFQFSSWAEIPAPDPPLLGPIDSITAGFVPDAWKLEASRILQSEPDKMSLSETFWRSNQGNAPVLRLQVYKCASVVAARDFLLNLLADFQTAVIERRDPGDISIGDLAFADRENLTLLFARSNLVVFVQNAGDADTSVLSFARDVDLRVLKVLRNEPGDKTSRKPNHY